MFDDRDAQWQKPLRAHNRRVAVPCSAVHQGATSTFWKSTKKANLDDRLELAKRRR